MEMLEASLLFLVVALYTISIRRVPTHSHEGRVIATSLWPPFSTERELPPGRIFIVTILEKTGTVQIMVSDAEFAIAMEAELECGSIKIKCASKLFFHHHRSVQLINS